MRILIVEDGRQRAALAAVRSLGRSGHEVGVAAPVSPLSGLSRWCTRTHETDPASSSSAGDAIRSIARAHNYDLVFGVGDVECLMLARSRARIEAVVGVVEHEALVRALDKTELAAAGEAVGMRTPVTVAEIPEPFPAAGLVIKEKIHGEETGGALSPHSAPALATTREEAIKTAGAIEDRGGTPLFQEVIDGGLIAYSAARTKEGRLAGEVQQRALLTYPHRAGISVRAVTTEVDAPLRAACGRLLDELAMWGVAEIQMIAPRNGPPVLIDVNPRFYGSIQLAISAGVDLPTLFAAICTDNPPPAASRARPGVRYHWLEGDLRRAASERRGGLVRDVFSCLAFAPGAAHSIASLGDPAPAMRFGAELLRRGLRKVIYRRG